MRGKVRESSDLWCKVLKGAGKVASPGKQHKLGGLCTTTHQTSAGTCIPGGAQNRLYTCTGHNQRLKVMPRMCDPD
eukprot:scaffold272058_cov18-Tisochrysis_lutea.AAC.1